MMSNKFLKATELFFKNTKYHIVKNTFTNTLYKLAFLVDETQLLLSDLRKSQINNKQFCILRKLMYFCKPNRFFLWVRLKTYTKMYERALGSYPDASGRRFKSLE
jgi:hypothetical protein